MTAQIKPPSLKDNIEYDVEVDNYLSTELLQLETCELLAHGLQAIISWADPQKLPGLKSQVSSSGVVRVESDDYLLALRVLNLHMAGKLDLDLPEEVIVASVENLVYGIKHASFRIGPEGVYTDSEIGFQLQKKLGALPLWFREKVFLYTETTVGPEGISKAIQLVEGLEYEKSDLEGLFPGRISLSRHDVIHSLMTRSQDSRDEALVIGFTMGSTGRMGIRQSAAYLYMGQNFYGRAADNFGVEDGIEFMLGTLLASLSPNLTDLSQVDFEALSFLPTAKVKELVGLPSAANFLGGSQMDMFRAFLPYQGFKCQVWPEVSTEVLLPVLESFKTGEAIEDIIFNLLGRMDFKLVGITKDGSEVLIDEEKLIELAFMIQIFCEQFEEASSRAKTACEKVLEPNPAKRSVYAGAGSYL